MRVLRVAIAPSGGSSISAQGSTSGWSQVLNPKQTTLLYLSRDGGAERDRTVDPLLAKQVLSQLSYSPLPARTSRTGKTNEMVGLGRFELPTSPLSGVRSNQLSYRPRTAADSRQSLA